MEGVSTLTVASRSYVKRSPKGTVHWAYPIDSKRLGPPPSSFRATESAYAKSSLRRCMLWLTDGKVMMGWWNWMMNYDTIMIHEFTNGNLDDVDKHTVTYHALTIRRSAKLVRKRSLAMACYGQAFPLNSSIAWNRCCDRRLGTLPDAELTSFSLPTLANAQGGRWDG